MTQPQRRCALARNNHNRATQTILPALVEAWPCLRWSVDADRDRVIYSAITKDPDGLSVELLFGVDGTGRWMFTLSEPDKSDCFEVDVGRLELDKAHRHLYAWLCNEGYNYRVNEAFRSYAAPFIALYEVEP